MQEESKQRYAYKQEVSVLNSFFFSGIVVRQVSNCCDYVVPEVWAGVSTRRSGESSSVEVNELLRCCTVNLQVSCLFVCVFVPVSESVPATSGPRRPPSGAEVSSMVTPGGGR